MHKTPVVFFVLLYAIRASAQGPPDIRLGVNLGVRNTGLSASYRALRDVDLVAGCNVIRYFNFGFYSRVRYFLQDHARADSVRKGAFFMGVGIEYMTRCHYNKEDSRKFVNEYYIPCNHYLTAELGYIFRKANTSISAYYYWSLRKNYAASLSRGSDVDGNLNKINGFIDGGWGGGIAGYIPLRFLQKRK